MVQRIEQEGYLTIEEPFKTHSKDENGILLNNHKDGARRLDSERGEVIIA